MSSYNPLIHNRRSIRLKGYDYSMQGLYFITICCQDRACMFGQTILPALKTAIGNTTDLLKLSKNCFQRKSENVINDRYSEDINPENIAQIELNAAGRMVEQEWLKIPCRFPNTVLHEYVVMPNHFHSIIEITDSSLREVNETGESVKAVTVGDIIGAFKSITTVEYINGVKEKGWESFRRKLWQRDYWEHIIRDEQAYKRISEYIINNPEKWIEDKLNSRE